MGGIDRFVLACLSVKWRSGCHVPPAPGLWESGSHGQGVVFEGAKVPLHGLGRHPFPPLEQVALVKGHLYADTCTCSIVTLP